MVVLFELALVEIYVIYTFVIHAEAGTLQASHYAAIILISLITLCFVIVSIKLFKDFELWRFRKLVSSLQTDVELRKLYTNYEAWVALMKLDINFNIIFILMGLFFFFSTAETFINMIGIFITFAWAFIGHIGVRMEDVKMMVIFFIFSVVFPADIIWKLYSIEQQIDPTLPIVQIIFAGVIALAIRIIFLFTTIRMVSNFGRNLRDGVFDPEEEEAPAIAIVAEKQIKPYLTLTVKKLSSLNLWAGVSKEDLKVPRPGQEQPDPERHQEMKTVKDSERYSDD